MDATLHLALYRGLRRENPAALFFDRLICWRTRSRWSHAELVLVHHADGPSLCASSSVRDGGVRSKMINLHTGRWDVYPLQITDEKSQEAAAWFERNLGKPYDYLGIFGFTLPVPLHAGWAWYCSEAIAKALGIEDRAWMSPQRLSEALGINYSNEGRLG